MMATEAKLYVVYPCPKCGRRYTGPGSFPGSFDSVACCGEPLPVAEVKVRPGTGPAKPPELRT